MVTPTTPETIAAFDLSYWGLQTVAMLITALLIPNLRITSIFGALLTVVALAFVNSTLWDAALFFQVPDHITTQALTLFIANGVIFWILVKLLPGIEVTGFFAALIAPVVFTLCSLVIDTYKDQIPWSHIWDLIVQFFGWARAYFQSTSVGHHPT